MVPWLEEDPMADDYRCLRLEKSEGVYLTWSDHGGRPHVRVKLSRSDLEGAALDLILGDPPTL